LSVAEIVHASAKVAGLPRVSPVTANKHIGNLMEYFEYLRKTKKVDREVVNPFKGLITPRKKGRAARHERKAWPLPLARKLFSSPLYSGCQSIHRRARPGGEIHRDALFWVPILGAPAVHARTKFVRLTSAI
jgi:hypothetical protein